jgi:hypothetical protein
VVKFDESKKYSEKDIVKIEKESKGMKTFFENIFIKLSQKEIKISRKYLICTFNNLGIMKNIQLLSYPDNNDILQEELRDILLDYFKDIQSIGLKFLQNISTKIKQSFSFLFSFLKINKKNIALKVNKVEESASSIKISSSNKKDTVRITTNIAFNTFEILVSHKNMDSMTFLNEFAQAYHFLILDIQKKSKKLLEIIEDDSYNEKAIENMKYEKETSSSNSNLETGLRNYLDIK